MNLMLLQDTHLARYYFIFNSKPAFVLATESQVLNRPHDTLVACLCRCLAVWHQGVKSCGLR